MKKKHKLTTRMPEEITMGPILRKPPTTTDDVRAIVNGSYSGDPHEVIKHMASTLAKELSPLRKSGRTDDLLHVIVPVSYTHLTLPTKA